MPTSRCPVIVNLAPQTKYDPETHDLLVVELAAQGKFPEQVAAHIGVSRATLYAWARRHPTFGKAMESARTACMAWWADAGQAGMTMGKQFNAGVWQTVVARRFPELWSQTAAEAERDRVEEEDRERVEASDDAVQLNPVGAPPRERDEILAELDKLVRRASDR